MSLKSTELSWHKIAQHYQAKEKNVITYPDAQEELIFSLSGFCLEFLKLQQQYGSSAIVAIGTRQKLASGQKLKLQRNKNRNERLGLIRSEGGYQRHTMEHQWEQVNALNHEKKIPKTKKMMIFVATHPRHFGISKELGIHLSQIHLLLFYFFIWEKFFWS